MSESCVFGGGGAPASGFFGRGSSREATTCFFGAVRACGTKRSGSFFGSIGLPSLSSEAWMTGRATSGFSSSATNAPGQTAFTTKGPMASTCKRGGHHDAEDDLVRRVARCVRDAGKLH